MLCAVFLGGLRIFPLEIYVIRFELLDHCVAENGGQGFDHLRLVGQFLQFLISRLNGDPLGLRPRYQSVELGKPLNDDVLPLLQGDDVLPLLVSLEGYLGFLHLLLLLLQLLVELPHHLLGGLDLRLHGHIDVFFGDGIGDLGDDLRVTAGKAEVHYHLSILHRRNTQAADNGVDECRAYPIIFCIARFNGPLCAGRRAEEPYRVQLPQ